MSEKYSFMLEEKLLDPRFFDSVIKPKIVPVLRKYNVIRAVVFGSFARGTAVPRSDIDLLVTISSDRRDDVVFDLWDDLEKNLQMSVSLLTEENLINATPSFKRNIYQEGRLFYGEE